MEELSDVLGREKFNRFITPEERDEFLETFVEQATLVEVIEKVQRQVNYILTFVEHEGVPKHNNFGEYIIKKGILKRKISGGSMSEEGAMAYAVLQSIAQTCHLRHLSFTEYLMVSLLQYIRTGSLMLLSQYENSLLQNQLAA